MRLPSRFGMELKRLPLVGREISVGVRQPQEGIRGFEKKKKFTDLVNSFQVKFPVLGFQRNSKGILDFRVTESEGLLHLLE